MTSSKECNHKIKDSISIAIIKSNLSIIRRDQSQALIEQCLATSQIVSNHWLQPDMEGKFRKSCSNMQTSTSASLLIFMLKMKNMLRSGKITRTRCPKTEKINLNTLLSQTSHSLDQRGSRLEVAQGYSLQSKISLQWSNCYIMSLICNMILMNQK